MFQHVDNELCALKEFLRAPTPAAWVLAAVDNLPLIMVDHAHCERKAAATALNFISKYPDKAELVAVMSPLAREELLHFEKVLNILHQRAISFVQLQPSEYANSMHKRITIKSTPQRLCDQLIVGAIIEARSCERFAALVPYLEDDFLIKFYQSLVKAEARHFEEYLRLARLYGEAIDERVNMFLQIENAFITSKDTVLRFHSGTM
jgi:tRNA-(ms[2]io[6]A)-hydroxylase